MKFLRNVLLTALLATGPARAADVVFTYADFGQRAQVNRPLLLYPLLVGATNASGVVTLDRITTKTGVSGGVTVTNVMPGWLRAEFQGIWRVSTNYYVVPDTTGTVYAVECLATNFLVGGPFPAAAPFWGKAELVPGSFIRFATNAGLVSINATNLQPASENLTNWSTLGTNVLTALGAATNVYTSVAGSGISIATEGYEYTISTEYVSQPTNNNLTGWGAFPTNALGWGVTGFNTRTGAVTLRLADVLAADTNLMLLTNGYAGGWLRSPVFELGKSTNLTGTVEAGFSGNTWYLRYPSSGWAAITMDIGAAQFAGDGQALTNLNGGFLQALTVKSNAIDMGTWTLMTNDLAGSGTNWTDAGGAGISNILSVGLTNGVAFSSYSPAGAYRVDTNHIHITGAGETNANGVYTWDSVGAWTNLYGCMISNKVETPTSTIMRMGLAEDVVAEGLYYYDASGGGGYVAEWIAYFGSEPLPTGTYGTNEAVVSVQHDGTTAALFPFGLTSGSGGGNLNFGTDSTIPVGDDFAYGKSETYNGGNAILAGVENDISDGFRNVIAGARDTEVSGQGAVLLASAESELHGPLANVFGAVLELSYVSNYNGQGANILLATSTNLSDGNTLAAKVGTSTIDATSYGSTFLHMLDSHAQNVDGSFVSVQGSSLTNIGSGGESGGWIIGISNVVNDVKRTFVFGAGLTVADKTNHMEIGVQDGTVNLVGTLTVNGEALSGGSATNLTPWTEDIDGGTYSLTNVTDLTISGALTVGSFSYSQGDVTNWTDSNGQMWLSNTALTGVYAWTDTNFTTYKTNANGSYSNNGGDLTLSGTLRAANLVGDIYSTNLVGSELFYDSISGAMQFGSGSQGGVLRIYPDGRLVSTTNSVFGYTWVDGNMRITNGSLIIGANSLTITNNPTYGTTFIEGTTNALRLAGATNFTLVPLAGDGAGLTNIPGSAVSGASSITNGLAPTTYVTTATNDLWTAVDDANYLTANQSISLSGDATGSGTTAITVTVTNVQTPVLTNQVSAASYSDFLIAGTAITISPTNGNNQSWMAAVSTNTLAAANTNFTETIRLTIFGSNTVTWSSGNLSNAAACGPSNAISVIIFDHARGTNLWWAYRLR